jgi:hypothetical protein
MFVFFAVSSGDGRTELRETIKMTKNLSKTSLRPSILMVGPSYLLMFKNNKSRKRRRILYPFLKGIRNARSYGVAVSTVGSEPSISSRPLFD